jgi:GTPase SAR1 family protein
MGKYAVLVMGPAGAGKSTFTSLFHTHSQTLNRKVHCVNLDPAAEAFDYPVSIDIRELIGLDDVMEELEYGPNGGLIFCFDYLLENMDWFSEQIGEFEDDFLIIDCPGQIELFSHLDVMKVLLGTLHNWGYHTCGVYLLDSHFITDAAKFISGTLAVLSAMIQLELPHVNILSKCDLLKNSNVGAMHDIEGFLEGNVDMIISQLGNDIDMSGAPVKSFASQSLHRAIGKLLSDYSMVSFIPLNPKDEDSIHTVVTLIENCLQYGEDEEPTLKDDEDERRHNDEENREWQKLCNPVDEQ